MKNLKTVTELDTMSAAHNHYLAIAVKHQKIADKFGGKNSFSNERARRSWARERELNNELLRLEKKNKK